MFLTQINLRVRNDIERFHLMADVIISLQHLSSKGDCTKEQLQEMLIENKSYVNQYGYDRQKILNRKWKAVYLKQNINLLTNASKKTMMTTKKK